MAYLKRLKELLPAGEYELLVKNQMGVTMEPRLAAAAFAYASVLDRLQYGTIPEELAAEMLRDQAATAAVALSTKTASWRSSATQWSKPRSRAATGGGTEKSQRYSI